MDLEKKVTDTIRKFNMLCPGDRVVAGLSGGADSCVLLYVLSSLSQKIGFTLVAAHLNHGIRGKEAERDMRASAEFSASLGVRFVSKSLSVPQYAKEHKMSEEMAGRKLRYGFFEEVCRDFDCNKIAVAHNRNDCAETILLNLMRGSGANGFGGIRAVNENIIRPLIETSRCEIESYAMLHSIQYVTDSTNQSDIYARNVVRNDILPKMSSINSAAIDNLIRCSEIITAENDFFDSFISEQGFCKFVGNEAHISRCMLEKAHLALARRIVLFAMQKLALSTANVSSKQIDALVQNIKTGLKYNFGNGYNAYITAKSVVITGISNECKPYEYLISPPCTIKIKETGITYRFEFTDSLVRQSNSICISADKLKDNSLVLRTRSDGDSFVPFGMKGEKKIKSFFIDLKIPAHMRSLYPLLVNGNEICAVVPLRTSEKYRIEKDTKKILMITKLGGTYDEKL